MSNQIRDDLNRQLSGVDWTAEDTRAVWRAVRKEEPVVKRKMSASVALVLVLTLLAAVGLAASGRLNLQAWIERNTGAGATLPDAAEQILQNVAEAETDNAVYRVREVVYDGVAAYILVDVTPRDAHTFLMPDGNDADLPIDDLIPGAEGTIGEYAAAHGYTTLAVADAWPLDYEGTMSAQWADSTLSLKLAFPVQAAGDALDVTLSLWTDGVTGTLPLRLPALEPLWTAQAEETVEWSEKGLRVDRVRMVGTAMATYYYVDCTAIDPEKTQNGASLTLYDETGKPFPNGALMYGSTPAITEVGQRVTSFGCAAAMAEAPAAVILDESSLESGAFHRFPLK